MRDRPSSHSVLVSAAQQQLFQSCLQQPLDSLTKFLVINPPSTWLSVPLTVIGPTTYTGLLLLPLAAAAVAAAASSHSHSASTHQPQQHLRLT